MSICFLSSQHIYNDSRILLKEAATLSAVGYDVYHLAPGETHADFVEVGVRIRLYRRRRGIFGRLRMLFDLYRRLQGLNPEVLHCNEVDSWVLGCWYKLWHGQTKVIFDVHEHYPSRFDEEHVPKIVALLGKPLFSPLVKVLSPITDFFIFAKRSVSSDYPAENRHEFIFGYALAAHQDRQLIDVPESVSCLYRNSPVAVHIGGFSRARGWPQLLEALERMENKDLKLFCIGHIAEGNGEFEAEAVRRNVYHRIRLFGRMDFAEMFDHLLCANIGCMVYQPGPLNHTYAFPMKLYDYMLAGLPVVGPKFSVEVAPVIEGERIGYCVDTSNPQSIANALDALCIDPAAAQEMGQRARAAAISRYNWDNEAAKLISVYARLAEPVT